ncbi:MAG TPA: hypothetical protein VFK56_20030 [Mycobacterium sp.]|nr:hypothetical protein [Mycobacterium sp.]
MSVMVLSWPPKSLDMFTCGAIDELGLPNLLAAGSCPARASLGQRAAYSRPAARAVAHAAMAPGSNKLALMMKKGYCSFAGAARSGIPHSRPRAYERHLPLEVADPVGKTSSGIETSRLA